jgi:hypothetical protein
MFAQPLPNNLAIVGQSSCLQAYSFAPGANALQAIACNGLEWFIGDL